MTAHDAARRDRALACDPDDEASLLDALLGLMSTDDPSLWPVFVELSRRLAEVRAGRAAAATPPP